ncbi:MAG: aminotransferase class III-fold pyridoxal phosphate-dependent enzyme, partial [Pseudobdellovibrio sp.]
MSKIFNLFKKTSLERSSAPAVSYYGQSLTYNELVSKSEALAELLVNKYNFKPNDLIALHCNKGLNQIILLFALIKLHATYLPIDLDLPIERKNYIFSHSKAKYVIINNSLREIFIPPNESNVLRLEEIFSELESYSSSISDSPQDLDYTQEYTFYLLYTSGSTGTPKGVKMGENALFHLIGWQNQETLLKENSVTLQYAPLSFDVHFQEIFSTLCGGGHLILISEQDRKDSFKLIEVINTYNINRLYLPFVAFNALSETVIRTGKHILSIQEITVAGEQLKITSTIKALFKQLKRAILFNHYGPTETHVVTSLKLNPQEKPVSSWPELPSIGYPTGKNKIYLLTEGLNLITNSHEAGEIIISGPSLADGYLSNPEETEKRFFHHETLGRCYRTGDLASLSQNGEFHFLGRIDRQIKIRGHRVELGEIEAQILNFNNIKQCAVIPHSINNIFCLKAIIDNPSINVDELKKFLNSVLPEFMIPLVYETHTNIPLTSSGKIDYKKLTSNNTNDALISEIYQKIKTIWKKYLPVIKIKKDETFFEMGGNSLSLTQMLLDLNHLLKTDLTLIEIFENNTLEKLTQLCHKKMQHQILQNEESIKITSPQFSKENLPANEKIAIIAIHGSFPNTENTFSFWKDLIANKNLVKTFDKELVHPLTDTSEKHVYVSGEYPDHDKFDYEFFGYSFLEAQLMDPQQRKFLELCYEALYLAGYPSHQKNIDHSQTSVFASMSSSRYMDLVREYPDKISLFGPFATSFGIEKDYLATRVAHKLNLGGPALNINTACSSSLVAVIQAVESLRSRQSYMAIAGGISIAQLPYEGHTYNEGSIYSSNNECRTFDSGATGTIFTHGSGVVVLKRLADAKKDNDSILGIIAGVGLSNDGSEKMSFSAPSIKGQAEAIKKAHLDAQINSENILFVETHGTGTPIGDPAEISGLSRAFNFPERSTTHSIYLTSVKANIGHLNAAAGVAGLIKALLSLKNQILPAQIHFKTLNPLIDLKGTPFIISKENKLLESTQTQHYAGVSSFGVGGTNAHVIIEKYPDYNFLKKSVLIFSGQGSQYQDMGQKLFTEQENVFKSDLTELSKILENYVQMNVHELFKSSVQTLKLQQLRIFTYQYLTARYLLRDLNHQDIRLVGCSLGEITAACIAETISLENAVKFISQRADLLLKTQEGAMLLVRSSYLSLKEKIEESHLDIAIIYSLDTFVVSGSKHEINSFKEILKQEKIVSLLLDSPHPFHSSKLKELENDLMTILTSIEFSHPKYNIIPTLNTHYKITDKEYWQQHILKTVNLYECLNSILSSSEVKTLIEIGPQMFLTSQIRKIAQKRNDLKFISLSSGDANTEVSKFIESLSELHLLYQQIEIDKNTYKYKNLHTELKKTPVALVPPLKRKANSQMKQANTSTNQITQQLLKILEDDLGCSLHSSGENILTTHFFELGLDSLVLTQLSSILKNRFRVQTSFKDLKDKYNTLSLVSNYIMENSKTNHTLKVEEISVNEQKIENFADTQVPQQKINIAYTVPKSSQHTSSHGVEKIIEMQLQLMQQQLQMLNNQTLSSFKPSIEQQSVTKTDNSSVNLTQTPAEKSFGAAAKINLHAKYNFSEAVNKGLNSFQLKYVQKTRRSKEFAEKSRQIHADPRSVSGFRPETKEITYPIVVERSEGQTLWDLDGNSYIDMLCGFGSNFFGNKNQTIYTAILEQLKSGFELGPQHPLTYDAAKLVSELTRNDRVAFCNTGSEAVLGAMRIARTVTAKKKIVTFSGSYHGINDDVIVRAGNSGQTIPAASGICSEAVSNTVVLDYGSDVSLEYIKNNAHEIAGVLVEPVQSRRCDFHPKEFLQKLRKLTTDLEICLIFDEIITGFRIQSDGAQGYFNISADLCTYGKIVGGGLPIGIIAGKAKFMNALDGGQWRFGDDSTPEDGVTYFAGTFVRHPLALAACKASLQIIKDNSISLYNDLNKKSEKFVEELHDFFRSENFPLVFDRFGSLMKPKWTTAPLASEIFFACLRYNGIHTYDGFPWFI